MENFTNDDKELDVMLPAMDYPTFSLRIMASLIPNTKNKDKFPTILKKR